MFFKWLQRLHSVALLDNHLSFALHLIPCSIVRMQKSDNIQQNLSETPISYTWDHLWQCNKSFSFWIFSFLSWVSFFMHSTNIQKIRIGNWYWFYNAFEYIKDFSSYILLTLNFTVDLWVHLICICIHTQIYLFIFDFFWPLCALKLCLRVGKKL